MKDDKKLRDEYFKVYSELLERGVIEWETADNFNDTTIKKLNKKLLKSQSRESELKEQIKKLKAELENIISNCRTMPDDPERTARILKLIQKP